ncbi:hypothetical protein Tco_1109024 [Tanacetum coccineum]
MTLCETILSRLLFARYYKDGFFEISAQLITSRDGPNGILLMELLLLRKFLYTTMAILVHTLLHCISCKSGGWDPIWTRTCCSSSILTLLHLHLLLTNTNTIHIYISTQIIPSPTPPPIPTPTSTPPPIPTPTSPPPTTPETDLSSDEHNTMRNTLLPTITSHHPKHRLQVTCLQMICFKQFPNSEDEEPEVQGRKSQADPQDSSKQGLVTPPTTKAHASGEEQEEEISPNTLEAAKTLSKVASLKSRSIDKGRRYKRRKESTGKKVVSSLDFQEDNTGAEKVNAASIEVNTASKVNTGSIELNTVIEQDSTAGENKGQREGKAPMLSEETPKKTKERFQEEASLAEAIRLDSLQREEEAEQIHLDALLAQRIAEEEELTEQQKKRKAQVQFEAQHYTNEDWDLIRAKLEANAELSKSMLGKSNVMEVKSAEEGELLKKSKRSISRDDLTELYRIVMNRYGLDGPEDKLEKGFWKCLRIMFEEPLSTDSIWSEIEQQKIVSWRYYDTSRVHCLNLESMDVYLLSDRKYPLPAEVCKTMLKMKLLDGKMNEDCYRLLKMMEKQAGIVSNECVGLKQEEVEKDNIGEGDYA